MNRHRGKSVLIQLTIDRALNEGQSVIIATSQGSTLHKRHGHLTSITPLKREHFSGKQATIVIHDEKEPQK